MKQSGPFARLPLEVSPPQVQQSVGILKQKCEEWFSKKFGIHPWFAPPDTFGPIRGAGLDRDENGVLHVVLTGAQGLQLACSSRWPRGPFAIWVLSESSRKICTDLFGLPARSVGVIPRYELFPQSCGAPRPFNTRAPWTLVYGGRIAESKNLLFALHWVSVLQTKHRQNVDLVICGSAHGTPNDECRDHGGDYVSRIWSVCQNLKWTNPPHFSGRLGPTEWLSMNYRNPVAFSFSTDPMEDFGVALAQAQQAGWPVLVSDWGGHQDLAGSNVLKIPADSIAKNCDNSAIHQGLAAALAEEFCQDPSRFMRRGSGRPIRSATVSRILPIADPDFKRVRKSFHAKYPSCPKRRFSYQEFFAKLDGRTYFHRLTDAMSGGSNPSRPKQSIAVLTLCHTPFATSADLSGREILAPLEESWARLSRSFRRRITFYDIDTSDRHWPGELLKADLIVFLGGLIPEVMKLTRERFKSNARWVLYSYGHAGAGLPVLKDASHLLRHSDLWVAMSQAESRAIRRCYPDASIKVVPFPVAEMAVAQRRTSNTLLYVGRVAEAKELHTLLTAIAIVKKSGSGLLRGLNLEIVGGIDSDGNAFAGVAPTNYGSKLQELIEGLGLKSVVRLHGLMSLDQVNRFQEEMPHTFVSPSLQWGEDFGSVVARSIALGNRAILSAWGKHLDLQRQHPSLVSLCPVQRTKWGPVISPWKFADVLISALNVRPRSTPANRRFRSCGVDEVSEALDRAISIRRRGHCLRPSRLTSMIYGRLLDPIDLARRFDGFDDPLSWPLLEDYGMPKQPSVRSTDVLWVPPWVKVAKDRSVIHVEDPRRGSKTLPLSNLSNSSCTLKDLFGHRFSVSEMEARWLWDQGAAFDA